jgi:hypothetical protein
MAREPGRAFSRDELLDAVWGEDYLAGSNVVDQAMAGLRRKLGDDPRSPTFIETVTGVGYRLRPGGRRSLPAYLPRALIGAAIVIVLVLAGLAAGLAVWLSHSETSGGEPRRDTVRFHATARLTDPGVVTGADCSEDLVVSGSQSESAVSGDIAGLMTATSTSRLYQDTDCLSGVSDSELLLTDDEGDALEGVGRAPVITYRLPDMPNEAVNHQTVSITITGGSGKYAGVRGDGVCDTLSRSTLAGDQLEATSESDCVWTLSFPLAGRALPAASGPVLDLSASPSEIAVFGREAGIPSQARFLVAIRSADDEPLNDIVLTLPEPEDATIQARVVCGAKRDSLCAEDSAGAPPRGARSWALGDLKPGAERQVEFVMQLLYARAKVLPVHVQIDAAGLAQPLKSREIEFEVAP